MGVKGIVLPAGAYKNASNAWMYVYGSDTVTMTDESGNAVDIQNLPCWLPPNFTLTPTLSTNRLLALKADTPGSVMEFAGFLSKAGLPKGVPPVSGLAFTVKAITGEKESATLSHTSTLAGSPAESAVLTHT